MAILYLRLVNVNLQLIMHRTPVLSFLLKDVRAMVNFFKETGYCADIPTLRKTYPALKTWEDFCKENFGPKAA